MLFHLGEAVQELQSVIAELEKNQNYDEVELRVSLEHVYNHVNTAWNSRDIRSELAANHSDDEFYLWRQFPADIDMG